MRVSVVIATCNRAPSLRVSLDALRRQTHRDFEVVVVEGPCNDGTPELLAERADELRVVRNPELNLCKSRNLGIDAAAGEVVAFIDDDGIPEPEWLERLVAGYDDPRIGGVGGIVYDATGTEVQYRWSVCDRLGETWFDREPPLDEYLVPGADPFLYLQGTNMSFRREALEAVLGFDENIEYMWDESDLALHLVDAGWKLRQIDGAGVVHKLLPNHLRDERGMDPFTPVKNRTYFALRNGTHDRPSDEVFEALARYLGRVRAWAEVGDHRALAASDGRRFIERVEGGFKAGVAQGLTGERAGRRLARQDPGSFLPYPTVAAEDRLRLCFVSLDYPPAPMGGIARYTADLARGFAARGHEVHMITRSDPPRRLDFEEGVWVHRQPEPDRHLPALEGHPLQGNLAHCAGVWHAVDEVDRRFGLDLVTSNVWSGETLFCALDPRWPTVMTCATPTRAIATAWQVRLEDEALARADHLHSISQGDPEMQFGDGVAVERLERLFRDVIAAAPPRAESNGTNFAEVARGRLREVLRTFDVANPDRAGAELLEPSAFPHDYSADIARLEAGSHSEFVGGLYPILLDREPDSAGLERYLGALAAGATRLEVVETIARSDEARSRGLDTRFLERLATEGNASLVAGPPAATPDRRSRLATAPGIRHARRIGRRVLRARRSGKLRG